MSFHDLLNYDPETGLFHWKVYRSRCARPGDAAGVITKKGYVRIKVGAKSYMGHHLAWFMTHGHWPKDQIDHVNGVRDDNRLANLRECTAAQNSWNTKLRQTSTSGFKGVSLDKRTGKFLAYIFTGGKLNRLGLFDAVSDAAAAAAAARNRYHGEFARHG